MGAAVLGRGMYQSYTPVPGTFNIDWPTANRALSAAPSRRATACTVAQAQLSQLAHSLVFLLPQLVCIFC